MTRTKPTQRSASTGKFVRARAHSAKVAPRRPDADPTTAGGAPRPPAQAATERLTGIDVKGRVNRVVEVAGSKAAAARLLDVDPAQTTRWAAGASVPAGTQAVRLLDLEYVMAHARLVWATDQLVSDWLTTPNAHLEHAAPVEYMRVHGTADVVEALRAEAAGAYA